MRSVRRHALALAPGTSFLIWFIARARVCVPGFCGFTLFDDAMISMSYGRTLAKSHQWTWFPGGPRVQGFTNPLWTLYMAQLHALGLSGSSAALAVSITGVVLLLGTALLASRLVRRALAGRQHGEAAALFACATVPFLYPLVFWTLRGMEVGLLALLTLWMVDQALTLLRVLPDPSQSDRNAITGFSVAACLGILTRLDFALAVLVVVALVMFWLDDARLRFRFGLVVGTPIFATTMVMLCFQRLYFGDWLPNTYRLKLGGIPLGDRLQRGGVTAGKAAPITLLVVVAVVLILRSSAGVVAKRTVALLAAIWASGLVYSVWVGGDAWEWSWMLNRYLVVGLAAAIVVLFIALAELLDQAGQLSWWTPVILVSLSLSTLGVGARTNPFRFERRYTTPSMLWLLGALLVAVTAIGYCRSSRRVRVGSTVAGVATLLAIVVAVSGVPGVRWYHLGGIHVRDDAKVTAEALALRSATLPGAVVATVWAGAPAYYSDRTMIDLLGKSDRHIANRPPQRVGGETVDFFPGHNKWDYTYSIRDRKPDVVYQLWRGSSRSNLRAWGYEPKCLVNGKLVWVLRTSQLIDRSKLLICN